MKLGREVGVRPDNSPSLPEQLDLELYRPSRTFPADG